MSESTRETTAAEPVTVPPEGTPDPLVTISGLFGTGHRVVGAKVADLLDVGLVDRSLAEDLSRATGLSDSAVWASEGGQSRVAGVLNRLTNAIGAVGASGSPYSSEMTEATYRQRVERHLARARFRGGVVIGRGGMVVLHDVPWALHVGLYGPADARLEQEIGLIRPRLDRAAAVAEQRRVDRDRTSYLRNAYHVDQNDPANYDLMIDSTTLDLDVVAETIANLAREQLRRYARDTRTDAGGTK